MSAPMSRSMPSPADVTPRRSARGLPARAPCLLAWVGLCLVLAGCGNDGDEHVLQVTPAKYDFGRIRHGEVRSTRFTIRNNGTKALTLAKAEPNCGCFKTARLPRRRLDPGQETTLQVLFESGAVPAQRLRGKFVEIRTDDPEIPMVRIPLEGHIYAPVRLEVGQGLDKLYFGLLGAPDNQRVRKFFLRVEPGYEAELDRSVQHFEQGYAIYPAQLASRFEVEIKPVGHDFEVSVRLADDAKPPVGSSQMQATITIRVKEHGQGMPDRTVPYVLPMHGTWPSQAPPGN